MFVAATHKPLKQAGGREPWIGQRELYSMGEPQIKEHDDVSLQCPLLDIAAEDLIGTQSSSRHGTASVDLPFYLSRLGEASYQISHSDPRLDSTMQPFAGISSNFNQPWPLSEPFRQEEQWNAEGCLKDEGPEELHCHHSKTSGGLGLFLLSYPLCLTSLKATLRHIKNV